MSRHRINLFEEMDTEEPLINLTPLIDVVFVVLITFIILAPILNVDSIELAKGNEKTDTNNRETDDSAHVSITVKEDSSIWVDGRSIALSDLSFWLQKKHQAHPQSHPRLLHDRRAAFGTYQEIKNRVEACGFEELDVILLPN